MEILENSHETVGFSSLTTHLHIGWWWSKKDLVKHGIGTSTVFTDLSPFNFFLFLQLKSVLKE
jgi:hypothetical protein